jgi:tRNA 2-thiocytidine biosynthesis protein TtcA
MKRKKMKKLLQDLEKDIPNIGSSLITAMGKISSTQLMDEKLWDFKNLEQRL